jgi:cell division protein FtsB
VQLDAVKSQQDKLAYIPDTVHELERKVDTLETDVESLKTRTGIIGGINAAFAAISATIAGYLGTR